MISLSANEIADDTNKSFKRNIKIMTHEKFVLKFP